MSDVTTNTSTRLMFSEKDVENTKHSLLRKLRTTFYINRITVEIFNNVFDAHGSRKGWTPTVTNNIKINCRKVITIDHEEDITERLFQLMTKMFQNLTNQTGIK